MWLNTRKTVQEIEGKMGVSYTIKKFNCEICNEPFPVTVKNKDKFLRNLLIGLDILPIVIPCCKKYFLECIKPL